MIRIIGDGLIPETACVYDLAKSLHFDQDVYLLSHLAPLLDIELENQVIYNLEPLYEGCRSYQIGYLDVLRKNLVLDYSLQNVKYLKSIGIEAFYLPYLFHPELERFKSAEKLIDVLFIGSHNERRNRILKQFKNLDFLWAEKVYGDELDKLVASAKVILNVHYIEDHPLEVVRLNYLIANKSNIVSEPGNDSSVNEYYANFIRFSDEKNLYSTVISALNYPMIHNDSVEKIPMSCEKAQEWITARLK